MRGCQRQRWRGLRRLAAAGLVAVVAPAPLSVLAHTVDAPMGFSEVVAAATLVVRGRVTGARQVRLPGRELNTAVTVAVDSVLAGEGAPFVSVVLPGGRAGRVRTVMVGVPVLEVGDRAVLFLRRGPDGLWRPVGLAEGIYRVRTTGAGLSVVRAPILLGVTASPGAVRRGGAALAPMALAEFEALVALAGRGPSRRIEPVRRTR